MPVIIRELLWDDWNEEHISQHSVTPEEVEEVCFGEFWPLHVKGRDRILLLGFSYMARRMLAVISYLSWAYEQKVCIIQ